MNRLQLESDDVLSPEEYFFSNETCVRKNPTTSFSNDNLDIWEAKLKQPERIIHQLAKLLSRDERRRASEYYLHRDRQRFTVGRGILRKILATYLDTKAKDVRILYGPFGKPELDYPSDGDSIEFNVSHSNELVLYSITKARKVGIDLEHIHDIWEIEKIVNRYFSEPEKETFGTLPKSQRREAFFTLWTRKEAYSKALGYGQYLPFKTMEQHQQNQNPSWMFYSFSPYSGYVATIVIEDSNHKATISRYRVRF